MSPHDLYDRYADWIYRDGMRNGSVVMCGSAIGGGVLLTVGVSAATSLIGCALLAIALFTFITGFHGIDRAFPLLPCAPDCTRKADR